MVVVVVVSGACAVVFAASDAAPDGGSVLISTGLDDSSSWVFSLRTPCAACCGLLSAGVDGWFAPAEAMAAGGGLFCDVSGDSNDGSDKCSEGTVRGVSGRRLWGAGRRRCTVLRSRDAVVRCK